MKIFCAALLLLAGLAGGLLPEAAVAEEKPVVRQAQRPSLRPTLHSLPPVFSFRPS